MRRIISLFLIIWSLFIFNSNAQNESKPNLIFNDSILQAAKQGNVEAQYNLGFIFDMGWGVDQSDTEAVKWYLKAANQEFHIAQYALGQHYKDGKGVKQSDSEAVKWFIKSANKGLFVAQFELGECYRDGRGVQQSDTEAAKWFRKGATQGYDYAQYELGKCYRDGRGVQQSYKEAEKWFRKAADQGFSLAQELLEDKVATKAFSTEKRTQLSYGTNDTVTTITESFRVTKKFKKGTRKVTKRIVGQDTTIIKDAISFI